MKGDIKTDNLIKEMLEKGITQTQICKKLQVGHARVGRIARNYGIVPNTGKSGACTKPKKAEENRELKVAPATGGFDLKGKPLMAKRPTDVWGPRFNTLRVETGYLPEVLAEQWGCSVETLRSRAKTAKAVRYTEHDGQYVEIIVNPKTRDGK